MKSVETKSFFRSDEEGRLVEVSFTKIDGELTEIRVCTFFMNNAKLRSYYSKEDEEFESIRIREEAYLRNFVNWISEPPKVEKI